MRSVSIIIPSHNRCQRLRRTLQTIAQVDYDMSVLEVVVVADGCVDNTVAMLSRQATPFTLRWVKLPGSGAAAARNAGASAAIGSLLVFLDDDIDVTTGWLSAHVAAHEQAQPALVIGYLPLGETQRNDLFYSTLRLWWSDFFDKMNDPTVRLDHRVVITGNMSLSADLFEKIGRFDENFRIPREDYEFGLRAIKLGVYPVFAADAVAYHFDQTTLNAAVKRKFKEGAADVLLGQRHPDAICSLPIYAYAGNLRIASRLLRRLAEFRPKLGDAIVNTVEKLMPTVAYFQLVPLWQRLLSGLFVYWYWRGVRSQLTTRHALRTFLRLAPDPSARNHTTLDLTGGLATLKRKIETTSPNAASLYDDGELVTHMDSIPYAEPLRRALLDRLLIDYVAPQRLFDLLFSQQARGLARRKEGEDA